MMSRLRELKKSELPFKIGSLTFALASPGGGKTECFTHLLKNFKHNFENKPNIQLFFFHGSGAVPHLTVASLKRIVYIQNYFETSTSECEATFGDYDYTIIFFDDFFLSKEKDLQRLHELCFR